MKVSLNWVKQFTDVGLSLPELLEKIGAQLGAVDEVVSFGAPYKGALVVKVVSCEKHANADKLSVCMVDDGGAFKKVKREKGLIRVVCGAPNVAAGQTVVWLPPGTTVPNTYDKDPFVLGAREIRGVVSNGMIASARELAIGDDHSGIVVIEEDIKPGTPFTAAFGLDDVIIDIENKMFTHRPDCFGMLGIAREIAGISGKAFKSPDWYSESPGLYNDGRKNVLKIELHNEVPQLVPRFCLVAVKDVRVAPSPLGVQTMLSRLGIRPINNIVDITNLVMLLTGQPLHAYDYDKLGTGKIGVRLSKAGEKLKLLNGKDVTLKKGTVVITDGQKPIGLGGVMGGAGTEVDEGTKSIVLEAASFDMNLTRKTAFEYGLFTDAATRFTKNQSPRQNMAAIVRAVEDVRKIAGGRVASKIIDDKHFPRVMQPVKTDIGFINQRLGTELSAAEAKRLLKNVEFDVELTGDRLDITPPFWRTDIEIPEDIVEEVGRLFGYEHLPLMLPSRDIEPAPADPMLRLKSDIRAILAAAGANEVLTYSFVNGSLLKRAGQDPDNAYHIRNALSPDLQHYRLSLVPSLLDRVHPNIQAGFDEFALFETGKGHLKGLLDEEGLPKEIERVVLVVAAKNKKTGAPYFAVRAFCDYLLNELGITSLAYRSLAADKASKTATYYAPGRAAEIIVGGRKLGRVGEFKQSVKSAFKLPDYCAGFALDTTELLVLASRTNYKPLNRYPSTTQDLCLRTVLEVAFQVLGDFLAKQLDKSCAEHGYQYRIEPIDIFQRAKDSKHKQTTWRIELWHPERTLTTQEVNKLFDKLGDVAKKELNAERI